jgi:hypothetical protein
MTGAAAGEVMAADETNKKVPEAVQRINAWAENQLRHKSPRPDRSPDDRLSNIKKSRLREEKRIQAIIDRDRHGPERKAGPSRRKRTKMVVPTDERLAKGDHVEWVNPAVIDSTEQPIGLTRRFGTSHIDRLYRNGRLTWTQYYAGTWYRDQHERCSFALSVVGSYGARTSASEPSYGLPRTEAQARARQLYMKARRAFPITMLGFMERLLIHDELPRYGGSAAMKNVRQIAAALDQLAIWLKLPLPLDDMENS